MAAANVLGVCICIITDQLDTSSCDIWVQPVNSINDEIILMGFDSVSQHYYSLQRKYARIAHACM